MVFALLFNRFKYVDLVGRKKRGKKEEKKSFVTGVQNALLS